MAPAIMISIMAFNAYPNAKPTTSHRGSIILSLSLKEVSKNKYCCVVSKNDDILVERKIIDRFEYEDHSSTYPSSHTCCYRCLARELIR